MPISFKCGGCGHVFVVNKIVRPTAAKCPECSSIVSCPVVDIKKEAVKKANRKCEKCGSIFQVYAGDLSRDCGLCKKKSFPIVHLHKPKKLTKREFKLKKHIESLEKQKKELAESFESMIYITSKLGFSQERLSEMTEFSVKVITESNCIINDNINSFRKDN